MMSERTTSESNTDTETPTRKWTVLPEVDVLDGRPSGENHKRLPRIEVRLLVGFESGSRFYIGLSENLSEGGIFVTTRALQNIGSPVDLGIVLPERETIRAKGTVRWHRSPSKATGTLSGMGIRFDDLSTCDEARIRELGGFVPHGDSNTKAGGAERASAPPMPAASTPAP